MRFPFFCHPVIRNVELTNNTLTSEIFENIIKMYKDNSVREMIKKLVSF